MSNLITKHRKNLGALFAVIALSMTSCTTTQPLYTWHKYENAAYQNSKKSTDKTEKEFINQITKVINTQNGTRGVVPPGVYAEYGFYLYKKGQITEGIAMMKKEIETYPESSQYISQIIKQIEK